MAGPIWWPKNRIGKDGNMTTIFARRLLMASSGWAIQEVDGIAGHAKVVNRAAQAPKYPHWCRGNAPLPCALTMCIQWRRRAPCLTIRQDHYRLGKKSFRSSGSSARFGYDPTTDFWWHYDYVWGDDAVNEALSQRWAAVLVCIMRSLFKPCCVKGLVINEYHFVSQIKNILRDHIGCQSPWKNVWVTLAPEQVRQVFIEGYVWKTCCIGILRATWWTSNGGCKQWCPQALRIYINPWHHWQPWARAWFVPL